MAKPTAPENTPTTDAEAAAEKAASHKALLQKTLDDLTSRICDHPKTSLARRLVRCHRAGTDTTAAADAIFDALEATLEDARAVYAEGTKPVVKGAAQKIEVPSRVEL